jgi:hypothetical protein
MSIKIVPLTKAFPGVGYDTNAKRCHLFAQAGVDYLRACAAVVAGREQYGWNFYVELPLMHMTLELLVKAHAARVDTAFNPVHRKYQHKITKIINDYTGRVKVFSILENDTTKMELIEGLEASWEAVRYAEAAVYYEGKDWELFNQVAVQLADEYHKITGVSLL